MNRDLALQIVGKLIAAGVHEFCLCPGARNAALVSLLLEHPKLRFYTFFEERSAAFFALGRVRATDLPVAVVTTSGTAAGELLPATMEAHYTGLPLVLLTADRPRRFRGTGAPQTAEQVGLFGVYVEQSLDLAGAESLELGGWSRRRPLHLNACFEEPLLEEPEVPGETALLGEPFMPVTSREAGKSALTLAQEESAARNAAGHVGDFLHSHSNPLVLVGALREEDIEPVTAFLRRLGAPIYAEAPSLIRESAELLHLRIHLPDGLLTRAERMGYPIGGVLRIGGLPTLRLWRDLENLGGSIPVCSVSREPFAGLSWASVVTGSPARILSRITPLIGPPRGPALQAFLASERERASLLEKLLAEEPASEPGMLRALSRRLPPASRVFLGNSLPIREWDLVAAPNRVRLIGASRGLNGIDGQVSTFLGFCEPGAENWGILGDLTTLYDLAGPWVLPQLSGIRVNLAIINNQGGKIFSRMFPRPEFQNPHSVDFSAWARMWNLPHERWRQVPERIGSSTGRVIELLPNEAATTRFWEGLQRICR